MHVVVHESLPEHWRTGAGEIERGRLVVEEEDGTLWLWVHPQLLGHPSPIAWLFAPVTDFEHPGDLWGIDARGNLVVVECKLSTRDEEDPFEVFLDLDDTSAFEPERVLDDWLDRFELEDRWLDAPVSELPTTAMPGVVPHRDGRAAARRWPLLYERNRAFLGDAYIDAVIEYVARRRAPSQPFYYALVIATGRHGAFLGFNAERSRRELERQTRRPARAVGVCADVANGGGDVAIIASPLEAV